MLKVTHTDDRYYSAVFTRKRRMPPTGASTPADAFVLALEYAASFGLLGHPWEEGVVVALDKIS